MKNTFGQSIAVTIFGESHGDAIGAVIDGLCPGIEVDLDFIDAQLSKRRPSGKTDTPRVEKDNYSILSGVFEGKTTGTPIAIVIPNENTKSADYQYGKARPSHADYSAYCKYHGFEDYRGGGHFSGRITASIVAAGAIAMKALEKINIKIGTHILECAGVRDNAFDNISAEIDALASAKFPVLDIDKGDKMIAQIEDARMDTDSVGGILQTAIYGIPAGVGEPWFDSVESILSHALFSVGGVKGIEFGAGFDMAKMRGSQANDAFEIKGGKITTKTNNNGGINGGITNGMPIVLNLAIKPTPSIAKEQDTVDFTSGEQVTLQIKGRHDPAIVRRACVVVDSVCALAVADMIAQRYGTDIFLKGIK
ncbi:MAG: chorismate synthase [Ruminococcaceae bacterium]|nr:chorismate synthase [Oscillospiraceae bacterium]